MTAPRYKLITSNMRQRSGDVGPCCHEECHNRAVWIVEFTVNGVEVRAWVCDEHRTSLPEPVVREGAGGA